MCPIRSKQQQLKPTDSEQQKKAVLSSRAKDVCHFLHKYKAEEEFFNIKAMLLAGQMMLTEQKLGEKNDVKGI